MYIYIYIYTYTYIISIYIYIYIYIILHHTMLFCAMLYSDILYYLQEYLGLGISETHGHTQSTGLVGVLRSHGMHGQPI